MKAFIIVLLMLYHPLADAADRRVIDNHGKTIMYISNNSVRNPNGRLLYKISGNTIRTPNGKKLFTVR